MNTRVAILRVNQNPSNPVVLSTYIIYHSMATGMREGRIGQVDLLAIRDYSLLNNPSAPFERRPANAEHQWVNFYTLDIGYSFIVEAARLAFPTLPDNHLRALALQLVFDAALVVFVFFLFSQWNFWLGFLAAYLYTSNGIFYDLVSFAYYYYWDIPLTFVVLGSLMLAYRRPAEATWWLVLGSFALGCGVWLRGSWWPISLFLCAVAAWEPALRRKLLVPVLVFAAVAAPQVVRSSMARGHLTFTTRAVWHVALVGLGYYPNAYGLEAKDGTIFELTRQKYGVTFRSEDYIVHDQAAKQNLFHLANEQAVRHSLVPGTPRGVGDGQHGEQRALFSVSDERDLSNPVSAWLRGDGDQGRRSTIAGNRGGGDVRHLCRAHVHFLLRRPGLR